jgi:hypothetical protein
MAYPTVDKPYGLKPVNLIGGQVFAGATRQMEIATTANVGYGTSIFYGDLVTRVTGGTIEKDVPEPPQQHRVACFWGVLLLIRPLVKCSFNNFILQVHL